MIRSLSKHGCDQHTNPMTSLKELRRKLNIARAKVRSIKLQIEREKHPTDPMLVPWPKPNKHLVYVTPAIRHRVIRMKEQRATIQETIDETGLSQSTISLIRQQWKHSQIRISTLATSSAQRQIK